EEIIVKFHYSPLAFVASPDGKRVAYASRADNKQFVIVDGKEQKRYDGVGTNIVFSPDSQRVAYRVQSGKKQLVV
ncbi:MAG: hypothetical protein QMD11_01990, partial [Smithella sp.]|nr:hypothetical protein [Smithella sp.]